MNHINLYEDYGFKVGWLNFRSNQLQLKHKFCLKVIPDLTWAEYSVTIQNLFSQTDFNKCKSQVLSQDYE